MWLVFQQCSNSEVNVAFSSVFSPSFSYLFLWNLSALLFSYFSYFFIAVAASMVSEGVHQAEIGIIARRGWRKSRMHGSPGGAPGAAKACPRTPKTEQTQKNIKNMIFRKVVNIRFSASTHEKHHFYLSKINIFDFSALLVQGGGSMDFTWILLFFHCARALRIGPKSTYVSSEIAFSKMYVFCDKPWFVHPSSV